MSENKTQPTEVDVDAFIEGVDHAGRRQDAFRLNALFKEVTGWQPRMWGPSIIGYGRYHYVYDSGREGDFLATGFSPRKANMVLYIMPGYEDYGHILDRLGKYKKGRSCLYLGRLRDEQLDPLADLIRAGLKDLNGHWPVQPS